MNQDNTKTKKTKKKKRKSVFKIVIITFLSIALFCAAAGTGIVMAVVKSSPVIDTNIMDNLKESSSIYDKDGKLIGNLANDENRSIVKLDQIPENLQNAFISIEDERFRTHHGIDIKRIFGALWIDLKTHSMAQGASTITQQLVRNVALTKEKRVTRKIQEAYLSIELERKLTKDQILEAYLNTIPLGGNSYGVQAASMQIFGKDVSKLDLAQSALIAGITRNPSRYYPLITTTTGEVKVSAKRLKYSKDRQKVVLGKMLELGYINQQQYDSALKEKLVFHSKKSKSNAKYQWFVEPAIEQVAKDLSVKYNISINDAKQKLRIGGYKIYLTVDTKLQSAAEEILNDSSNYRGVYLKSSLKKYSADGKTTPVVQPQAAAVIYDYKTGQMRAIVGGRGDHPLLSMNRATDVPRQPGSSIKPLAVYGPAIDRKVASAATVIEDSPMPYDFVKSHNGWNPKNYGGGFRGPTTIRDAITHSINLVAVKLQLQVGTPTSVDYLENKFHISTITDDDKYIAPLSLGGLSKGVYPYEMAAAYGVFGNSGIYSEPIMYTKIVDRNDDTILERTSKQSRSLSPQAAYIMANMMRDVVIRGTGTAANLGAMPAAGKTGTTSDNTNVWFCGYTPYLSGAVWIGHDKPNTSISGLKSSMPAKIWGKIMKKADEYEKLSVKQFTEPSGIVTERICSESGQIAGDYCPPGTVRTEVFIDGTQPVQLCTVHTQPQTQVIEADPNNPNNNQGQNNPGNNPGDVIDPNNPGNTSNPGDGSNNNNTGGNGNNQTPGNNNSGGNTTPPGNNGNGNTGNGNTNNGNNGGTSTPPTTE